jgi:predicted AAA+ superfamily ATPase
MRENHELTQASLLYMFCRKAKGREYFDENLDDYLSHRRVRWDLGVDIEPSEKVFDGFEEIDKGIVTRTNILYRLQPPMSRKLGEDKENIRQEVCRFRRRLPLQVGMSAELELSNTSSYASQGVRTKPMPAP